MRFKLLISSALVLAISAPAFAQEDYTEFSSKEDFFTVTFPGTPVVTEGTWLTEYFVNLPSKFVSGDGRTAWLCYSANFTNLAKEKHFTLLHVPFLLEARPPGSRYGMV